MARMNFRLGSVSARAARRHGLVDDSGTGFSQAAGRQRGPTATGADHIDYPNRTLPPPSRGAGVSRPRASVTGPGHIDNNGYSNPWPTGSGMPTGRNDPDAGNRGRQRRGTIPNSTLMTPVLPGRGTARRGG